MLKYHIKHIVLNKELFICLGLDTSTNIVKSFNFVFSNFKQSTSFIIFISDNIVKGSTLSNNFLGIILVGNGGALLLI